MNYLVFSDSHGKTAEMVSLIHQHAGTLDGVIHLGDGAADVLYLRTQFPALTIHAVLGNCDPFSYTAYDILPSRMLNINDKKVFCCHGNLHGASVGIGGLLEEAARMDADIVLFGHTHTGFEQYLPADDSAIFGKPRWILNPGSISKPRDGAPSYAHLHISDKGVLFSLARIGGLR